MTQHLIATQTRAGTFATVALAGIGPYASCWLRGFPGINWPWCVPPGSRTIFLTRRLRPTAPLPARRAPWPWAELWVRRSAAWPWPPRSSPAAWQESWRSERSSAAGRSGRFQQPHCCEGLRTGNGRPLQAGHCPRLDCGRRRDPQRRRRRSACVANAFSTRRAPRHFSPLLRSTPWVLVEFSPRYSW